jgi:hypothetical protein
VVASCTIAVVELDSRSLLLVFVQTTVLYAYGRDENQHLAALQAARCSFVLLTVYFRRNTIESASGMMQLLISYFSTSTHNPLKQGYLRFDGCTKGRYSLRRRRSLKCVRFGRCPAYSYGDDCGDDSGDWCRVPWTAPRAILLHLGEGN